MRRPSRIASALVALALLAPSAAVLAQDDARRASELAEQAIEAFGAGEVEAAIALYEEAFELVPDPSFAFNLASLYQSVGDLPNAERYFSAYLELFPGATDRADVETALEQIRSELQRGYAQLIVETDPAGATVALVGDVERELGVTPLSTWLAPGSASIVLRLDGHEEVVRSYNAVAGVRIPVDQTLVAIAEPEPVEPDPNTVTDPIEPDPVVMGPSEPSRDGGSSKVVGFALLGAGVAFVGGGIGMYFAGSGAADEHNDLVEAIVPGVPGDADEIDRLASQARTLSTSGAVGAGVGLALVGVGTWLVVRDAPAEVAVVPTRGGFAVSLSGRF